MDRDCHRDVNEHLATPSCQFFLDKTYLALACAVLGLGACAKEPPVPVYECTVHVASDPGVPLPDVQLFSSGVRLGATDKSGNAKLQLRGVEGGTAAIDVRCPNGFRQRGEPIVVTLKGMLNAKQLPEYRTLCAPELRTIIVAVRAEQGPNLPVLHLGQEVAKTDTSGTAHVSLKQAPNAEFELTLSTLEAKQLRPQNPSLKFVVRDRDEVLPMVQRFTLERGAKPKVKQKPPPKDVGPVRLK
jgi:hypothetical protein